jgi:NitT/TauT family transport system substrate-binding protein
MSHLLKLIAATLALAFAGSVPVSAKDKIRIAAPHPTIISSTLPVVAKELGLFDKADVDVEILWTAGGADAQQAAINGSVDLAVQTGLAGVLSAIQRGAPITVAAADSTGAADVVWMVLADKPWKTLADLKSGESVSFSRPGSSSDFTLRTLIEHYGAKVRALPSGSQPETLVMIMSGQIDAGFANPPLPKEVADGKLRIIARGNDSPKMRSLTVRVHAINTNFLEKNTPAVKRFLAAWRSAIDALYVDPKAVEVAAGMVKITPEQARDIIKEFMPKEATVMDRIGDLDVSIEQAITNKQLKGPLTDEQKAAIHKTVAELNAK